MKVRTRFAPSPTGMLHLGGARTALFNYLFARHEGGEVLLRIEDTDRARSRRRFEEGQLEDLAWLGLTFDGNPVRQSERGALYREVAERLLRSGLAYEKQDEAGRRALYFRPPLRRGSFRDGLRGKVPFSGLEDFVIMKSDGMPAYNFACVVDDAEMGVTHVIRGEEHLSNTARQALLYRSLGFEEPEFIHLGVVLGPDGKKLSKRSGARSVSDYRKEGYLPEALVSYLVLLGWSHPEGREDFRNLGELVREFDPSRLHASPAIFDPKRLLAVNARRLRALPVEELERLLAPALDGAGIPPGRRPAAVEAIRSELRTLSEAPGLLGAITSAVDPEEFVRELPRSSAEVYGWVAAALRERKIEGVEDAREFVGGLRSRAREEGMSARELLHPLRLALTGRERGPEIPCIIAVLGPEEAARRIEAAREARLRAS